MNRRGPYGRGTGFGLWTIGTCPLKFASCADRALPERRQLRFRPGRHIPIPLPSAGRSPSAGKRPAFRSPSFNRARRIERVQETFPPDAFAGEPTGGWTQNGRIALHHGFVLFLGDLVNSQIKASGEGDSCLASMACLPVSVIGLPMKKVPGSTQTIFKSAAKGTLCLLK